MIDEFSHPTPSPSSSPSSPPHPLPIPSTIALDPQNIFSICQNIQSHLSDLPDTNAAPAAAPDSFFLPIELENILFHYLASIYSKFTLKEIFDLVDFTAPIHSSLPFNSNDDKDIISLTFLIIQILANYYQFNHRVHPHISPEILFKFGHPFLPFLFKISSRHDTLNSDLVTLESPSNSAQESPSESQKEKSEISKTGVELTIEQSLFRNGHVLLKSMLMHTPPLMNFFLNDQSLLHDIFHFPNSYRILLTQTLLSPTTADPSSLDSPYSSSSQDSSSPIGFTNEIINSLLKYRVIEKLLSNLETISNGFDGSNIFDIIASVISACLSSTCHTTTSTTTGHLESYSVLVESNREDILSTICSFEVNGILLNIAKLCAIQIPSQQEGVTEQRGEEKLLEVSTHVINSLIYLTLCKDRSICYSKISQTFQSLTQVNLRSILGHYDYLKDTIDESNNTTTAGVTRSSTISHRNLKECTEIVQVFIDLIPRIMSLRTNSKRKSLAVGMSGSGSGSGSGGLLEQQQQQMTALSNKLFMSNSRKYLVSYLRILSTLVAGHVEVRGRSLAKRLPLGSIAYSPLDDFDLILFDEFCRSMAVAVFSSPPPTTATATTVTPNEIGKHLEPQLLHVCMHSGSLLSRHPEFAPSYLMLATSILLTKDPHKFKILFEAKILDFCLVILTTSSLSHHLTTPSTTATPTSEGSWSSSQPAQQMKRFSFHSLAAMQFLSSLIICYPSFISVLVLDPRFQVFFFNNFTQLFSSSSSSSSASSSSASSIPLSLEREEEEKKEGGEEEEEEVNDDFWSLIQFWMTFLIASDTFLQTSTAATSRHQHHHNHHPSDEDKQHHEQKVIESLVHLVWILFSALSSYPKHLSTATALAAATAATASATTGVAGARKGTAGLHCFLITLRCLRLVLKKLNSRNRFWSAQLLKKSISSSAHATSQWIQVSPETVEETSTFFGGLLKVDPWFLPSPARRDLSNMEVYLNQLTSNLQNSQNSQDTIEPSFVYFQAPSWISALPLSVLMSNLIDFSFHSFQSSFMTIEDESSSSSSPPMTPPPMSPPLMRITCQEIIQLALSLCCSSSPSAPAITPVTAQTTESSNLQIFIHQNSHFLFDLSFNPSSLSSLPSLSSLSLSPALSSKLWDSRLEWYQLVYESCVSSLSDRQQVIGSHAEFFVSWIELGIKSIILELNGQDDDKEDKEGKEDGSRGSSCQMFEDENLYKWIVKLCQILNQVIEWAHEGSSVALELAYSGLSLTLLHAHIRFFTSTRHLLHEILFPEELGDVAGNISDLLLDTISCLCGLYLSNDDLCCLLDIMNSTVSPAPAAAAAAAPAVAIATQLTNLSGRLSDDCVTPREGFQDSFGKSPNYYGAHAEMIRKWGYSVILASPVEIQEPLLKVSSRDRTNSFLARMKSLELPSGLHSPRKMIKDHHRVQLRELLATPAWCRIQTSLTDTTPPVLIARDVLRESHLDPSESPSTVESSLPCWLPMSSGYTISVWFSIHGRDEIIPLSGKPCGQNSRCDSCIHYALCRINGSSDHSLWPSYSLYICDGRVVVTVDTEEKPTIVFEPLLQLRYDGRWHHLVIRHHTNRPNRPFIMATLDGLPSQEYVLHIAPRVAKTSPSSSPSSSRRYSVSSLISIPKDDSTQTRQMTTLSLGPLLILRRPLNTAQVIALHGAGPHYSGVFMRMMTQLPLGEGGEIPLNLSYCTNVLAEAILKAKTSSKTYENNRNRSLNSLPGVLQGNIFTDPDLDTTNVMFAASSRWIPSSLHLHYPLSPGIGAEVCSSSFWSPSPSLSGHQMLSDLKTFDQILQRVHSTIDASRSASSSHPLHYFYTPRSDDSLAFPPSLTSFGDVSLIADPRPALSDITSHVINLEYIFRASLQLLLSSNLSQEIEYASRLFIFLLASFPSNSWNPPVSSFFQHEHHILIFLNLLRQKLEQGSHGNICCIGHFSPLLSMLAACPSKISKSKNMKVLWYGSSGEEDEGDDEDEVVTQLQTVDEYLDGLLTNREVMVTSDAILIHPNLLRLVIQLLLFQPQATGLDLERLLKKVLTSQLHPISRYTQINRLQFLSSNGLGHILCTLTYPQLSHQKILVTCEFLMKLIDSDIGIFEDYQAIFNLLLVISSHSKSTSIKFKSLFHSGIKNPIDRFPFAPSASSLSSAPASASGGTPEGSEEMFEEYTLLRQSLLLLLLQAINGFYATSTACRRKESEAAELLSTEKNETAASGGSNLGNDRDILMSVMKDTGGKSLETIVAAIPLGQLLYLLSQTIGLTLLRHREKVSLSRVVLLNPTVTQDYKSAILCLLIFSCAIQANFSTGDISASLLQQTIIELELYLPPLFFSIIFSTAAEEALSSELQEQKTQEPSSSSYSTPTKVPHLNLNQSSPPIAPSESPAPVPVPDAPSSPASPAPSPAVRLTSIIHGNSFLDLNSTNSNLESNSTSPKNLKSKVSASSILSNIKNTYQYFATYRGGITAIQQKHASHWLLRFVESVFDIAMGAPGTLKQNLIDLLIGWSLTELEPKYSIPKPLVDLSFEPSPQGMCIGLSALMNVIVDAARFSTACSLMFLSTTVAIDETGDPLDAPSLSPHPHPHPLYQRTWTEEELSVASNNSRSTCLTLLCCLYSLLLRSPIFRKFLFQPSLTKTHWATQTNPEKKRYKKFQKYTLLDVLVLGLVHSYFATSKARLMECLGNRSRIEDGLHSFEAGVQIPYEFVYVCTLTSIGSMVLQILTLLSTNEHFILDQQNDISLILTDSTAATGAGTTTGAAAAAPGGTGTAGGTGAGTGTAEKQPTISSLSITEREHVIASLESALLSPDEMTYPHMPKAINKAIHLTLNASLRRKILAYHYEIVSSEKTEDLTTFTSHVTAEKRLFIRNKIEKLSTLLVEIVRNELDLSSHCSGSIFEYLKPKIFEPVSMLMDITTFACVPLRLPPLQSTSTPPLPPPSGSSSSSSVATDSSKPSATSTNTSDRLSGKGFGWNDLMNNVKGQWTTGDETPSPSSSTSTFVPPRALIGGFLKKNFGNLLGSTETANVSTSQDPSQRENTIVMSCLTTALLAIRSSSILMLERLREKSQLRKEVLLFLIKFKYYFFRLLPKEEKKNTGTGTGSSGSSSGNQKKSTSGKGSGSGSSSGGGNLNGEKSLKSTDQQNQSRDLDLEYTACLSFYFYQCMHDEDVTLRIVAMKCWGEVFRSELSPYANELLVVQVNSISSDVMIQMKIDLWKYDRGGMYLLENLAWSAGSSATSEGNQMTGNETVAVVAMKGDENYQQFSRWIEDLSEDIRDAFETQISNTADRMRQEVMSNRSKAVRNRKEKWEFFSTQRAHHSQELYEYLIQLFGAKRREAREIQREHLDSMRQRVREWIIESTYSANLSKSLIERSSHQLMSGSRVKSILSQVTSHHKGHRSSQQSLTTIPPLLFGGGEYLPWTKWNETEESTTPFFVESMEVANATGEWALELSEGSNRMRRRVRRGNLALIPVYLNTGDERENLIRPFLLSPNKASPPPASNLIGLDVSNQPFTPPPLDLNPSSPDNNSDGDPAVDLPFEQNDETIEENYESDSSEDEDPPLALNSTGDTIAAAVSLGPREGAEQEETTESQDTNLFRSFPEIPKATPGTNKVVRKMNRMRLRRERRAHADNDPLSAFANDMDSHSLLTVPGDRLLFKCVGQQVMGMDSKKVICGISEMNYFYLFDCATSCLTSSSSLSPASVSATPASVSATPASAASASASVTEEQGRSSLSRPRRSSSFNGSGSGSGSHSDDVMNNSSSSGHTTEIASGNFQGGWSSVGDGEVIGNRAKYWKLSWIHSVQYRRYLLLPKALELFLLGGQTLFLRFQSTAIASNLLSQISAHCNHIPPHGGINLSTLLGSNRMLFDDPSSPPSPSPPPSVPSSSSSSSLSTHHPHRSKHDPPLAPPPVLRVTSSIEEAVKLCQDRWVNGEMSNFEYLMHLNTLAGRSYNDWGQYPIFPWVLQDYHSQEIDFNDPKIYRDLTKPMGALTEIRREEATEKFLTLQQQYAEREHSSTSHQSQGKGGGGGGGGARQEDSNSTLLLTEASCRPFHYGTHYSTAAIVLHYMIRLQPFASHAVVFQGDKFDHPDRLFQSIKHSWMSSSGGISEDPSTITSNLQDVKELIPEFFYLPDFLCNLNGYHFGMNSNELRINEIELPPWAHHSPQLFIQKHRKALESEYVSRHLHSWIDLIFGFKQTGEEAIKSCNLFRYLTYGNNLDIIDIANVTQRSALADEICSFGQTPNQLFKRRHPPRRIWNGCELVRSPEAHIGIGSGIGQSSLPAPPAAAAAAAGGGGGAAVGEGSLNVNAEISRGGGGGGGVRNEILSSDQRKPRTFFSVDIELTDLLSVESQQGGEAPFRKTKLEFLKMPHTIIGDADLLVSQLRRCGSRSQSRQSTGLLSEQLPQQQQHFANTSRLEIYSLVSVSSSNEMIFLPRNTLLLPSQGKFHLVLSYGSADATFRVFACPIRLSAAPRTTSQRRSTSPTTEDPTETSYSSSTDSTTASSRMLRGFEQRDRTSSVGSRSVSIDPGPSHHSHSHQSHRSISTASSSPLPMDTDREAALGQNWKMITSFDFPEISISCAALGGGSANLEKSIVFTGHATSPVVHMWSVDLVALQSASCEVFSLPQSSVPSAVHGVVLLHSFHTQIHFGGITSLSVCVRTGHLHGSSGTFSTSCQSQRVVLWDYSVSDEIYSPQPISSAHGGVEIYPLESSPSLLSMTSTSLSSPTPSSSSTPLLHERVHQLTFDTVSSDLFVCLGQRVMIFDPNGRFKSVAQPSLYSQHPILRSGFGVSGSSVTALCCQPIYCSEWESSRGFLVGYSDGSVILWAMRHYKDIPPCHSPASKVPSFRSQSVAAGPDDTGEVSYLSEVACLPSPQPTSPRSRSKPHVESHEEYLRRLLSCCSAYADSYEEWYLKSYATNTFPTYSALSRTTSVTDNTMASVPKLVSSEYLCCPVLCLDPTVHDDQPITSLRLSSNWEFIIAGRGNGTAVRWKVCEATPR